MNQILHLQTVKTYVDPTSGANISSSLYNVHDPPNGSAVYAMTRSEHLPPNGSHYAPNRVLQRFNNTTMSSQSETNIPNLNNYSPPNFKLYSKLGN